MRVSIMTNRFGDYLLRGGSEEYIFDRPTDNYKDFLTIANQLVENLFEPGVRYKKAGITLAGFTPRDQKQATLFDGENTKAEHSAWDQVLAVMDTLNKRHKDQLLLGTRLREQSWQAKKELRSPAYTTQWSQIAEVNT
jgi:DNA polymerase V